MEPGIITSPLPWQTASQIASQNPQRALSVKLKNRFNVHGNLSAGTEACKGKKEKTAYALGLRYGVQ
jgi:hypothetical protein